MDQRSQELILRLLGDERPDDAVMGEEEGGHHRHQWPHVGRRPDRRHGQLPLRHPLVCRVGRRRHRRPDRARCLDARRRSRAQPRDAASSSTRTWAAAPASPRPPAPARCEPRRPTTSRSRSSAPASGTPPTSAPGRPPCSSSCCRGCATSAGTAARRSTSARSRPVGSTPTTRRRSTRGTARPASSWPARRVPSSAARSTTCPTRDLLWGAAPGLAVVFGGLVRDLSARHVGPLG